LVEFNIIFMFKVYFNSRKIILTDIKTDLLKNSDSVYIKYTNNNNISDIIEVFETNNDLKSLVIYSDKFEKLKTGFKSFFNKIDAGGGIVVNKNNEYLFIKRNGIWDLPKGKKEKSEKISDTALREVTEECGLHNISISKKLKSSHHYYFLNGNRILKKTHWFLINYDGEELPSPQNTENITEAIWFNESGLDIIIQNTFPSVIDVIHQVFNLK
jgi:8-oxo-dGTP pyrophosphatase MutT (NUDIX family)